MRPVHLKVGDTAWCHAMTVSKDNKNPLVKGRVVHVFYLYNNLKHYVVEFPTGVDPVLEVRNVFAVSDSVKKPIGTWRR